MANPQLLTIEANEPTDGIGASESFKIIVVIQGVAALVPSVAVKVIWKVEPSVGGLGGPGKYAMVARLPNKAPILLCVTTTPVKQLSEMFTKLRKSGTAEVGHIVFNVRFEGQVMTGAYVSFTCTVKEQVVLFAAASVAI